MVHSRCMFTALLTVGTASVLAIPIHSASYTSTAAVGAQTGIALAYDTVDAASRAAALSQRSKMPRDVDVLIDNDDEEYEDRDSYRYHDGHKHLGHDEDKESELIIVPAEARPVFGVITEPIDEPSKMLSVSPMHPIGMKSKVVAFGVNIVGRADSAHPSRYLPSGEPPWQPSPGFPRSFPQDFFLPSSNKHGFSKADKPNPRASPASKEGTERTSPYTKASSPHPSSPLQRVEDNEETEVPHPYKHPSS
ncbi:hypothetical protein J3R30DRAFT_3712106 [Lentinula aciculospora]|uniref:Uncharacterized protein n=1 Tax=Lentinula aciculospora TaxID=153920 RepID=A0A9W8ZYH0_9AGAR|nr:hypothetical protein J3R30DRAFT_3712106 [Lentinula aciculospora]